MAYCARYATASFMAQRNTALLQNIRICRALKKRGVMKPQAYSEACRLLLASYRKGVFSWLISL